MKRILSLLLVLALAVSAAPAASAAAPEFGIGEVWTVDGQFSLEIVKVTETEERNEYSDRDPAAVYIVDYVYENLGYEDEYSAGLYLGISDQIVDAGGEMAYSYPGDITYYPRETPVGAKCYAQCCIGVDNPGRFKLYVTKYDSGRNRHKAVFIADPEARPVPFEDYDRTEELAPFEGAYRMGETWTVDGQWELTITGVTETKERNPYADYEPAAVYIIDYTYKNLGYEDEWSDGLYMSVDECVVDSVGFMGFSYPGDIRNYPKAAPEGAACRAQSCVGVLHAGNLQIVVTEYDSERVRHSAKFYIGNEPEPAGKKPGSGKKPPAGKEIRTEVREFLDEYEATVAEYVDFMREYMNSNAADMITKLGEYTKIAGNYSEIAKRMEEFDVDSLSREELAYYREVMDRVNRKLMELT